MTTYLGEFKFHVAGCESEDVFEGHLDAVLDFLSDDDRLIDPDYTATLRHRLVTFTLSAAAEDQTSAFELLNSALRAAIHAAEGGTANWERHFTETGVNVKPLALV